MDGQGQGQGQGKLMGQIIAKAWQDGEFKKRLLADAGRALKDEGVALPDGITVKAVENTDSIVHLVIPPKPASRELAEGELGRVAAGGFDWCFYIGSYYFM